MKKMLLTTTALATMAAGTALAGGNAPSDAHDLTIELSGNFNAQAGGRSQKSEYTKATTKGLYEAATGILNPSAADTVIFKRGVTPGNRSVGFDTEASLHATVKSKTASGLVYGAQVGIRTTTASATATQNITDNSYLFMENDMGRVELGSNASAAQSMKIGAERIARATGGIDGDWAKYVELDTFDTTNYTAAKVRGANFITGPSLVLDSVENSGSPLALSKGNEKSRKLTYYTPEYNGFQAGLSYIPDAKNTANDYLGELGRYNVTTDLAPNYGRYMGVVVRNAVAGGVSWKGTLDKLHHLKLSVVGEYGAAKNPGNTNAANATNYKDAGDVIVGAQWNYKHAGLAASFGWRGKSLSNKDVGTIASSNSYGSGYFASAGGSWTQGPWGASLTYMHSKNNKNKFNLVSLGADYELAAGLMPYAEVSYFDMKQKRDYWAPNQARVNAVTADAGTVPATTGINLTSSNAKNKGTAFILGTKINF